MPTPSDLAVALAIIVGNKKMLVYENNQGHKELPGFLIVPEEEALEIFQKLITQMGLGKIPKQTLYLTKIPISKSKRKQLPAIIRVIHLKKASQLDFTKGWFEPLSKLLCDNRVTALTLAVAEWITK
jgi:hypothetical protein